jgi:O-succinylbenzoic acid--CoA ligase
MSLIYKYSSEKPFTQSAQEVLATWSRQDPVNATGKDLEFTPPENTALIVNTSGSSGKPKTVIHTWDSLKSATMNSLESINHLAHGNSVKKYICCLPVNHVAGLAVIHKALLTKTDIDFINPKDYKAISESLNQDSICTSLVNTQINQIGFPTPVNSTLLIGGSNISKEILDKAKRLFNIFIPTYGMTETFGGVVYKNVINQNVNLTINSEGGIEIESSSVAPYFFSNDTMLPTDSFLATNDIGKFEDGKLTVLGRKDFVINSSGNKYYPEKLEIEIGHLIDQPFLVTSIPDQKRGELIVVLVEGSEKIYELPNIFSKQINTKEIPRLRNKKVDRNSAKKLALAIINK